MSNRYYEMLKKHEEEEWDKQRRKNPSIEHLLPKKNNTMKVKEPVNPLSLADSLPSVLPMAFPDENSASITYYYTSRLKKKNGHYYVISGEGVQEGDWVIDRHGVVYKQTTDKIFPTFTGACKITHSTEMLEGVVLLDLTQIEDLVYEYEDFNYVAYKKAIEKFEEEEGRAVDLNNNKDYNAVGILQVGIIEGNNLKKNKIFSKKQLQDFVKFLYDTKAAHDYKDGKVDFSIFDKTMEDYLFSLEGWEVQVDAITNKITII